MLQEARSLPTDALATPTDVATMHVYLQQNDEGVFGPYYWDRLRLQSLRAGDENADGDVLGGWGPGIHVASPLRRRNLVEFVSGGVYNRSDDHTAAFQAAFNAQQDEFLANKRPFVLQLDAAVYNIDGELFPGCGSVQGAGPEQSLVVVRSPKGLNTRINFQRMQNFIWSDIGFEVEGALTNQTIGDYQEDGAYHLMQLLTCNQFQFNNLHFYKGRKGAIRLDNCSNGVIAYCVAEHMSKDTFHVANSSNRLFYLYNLVHAGIDDDYAIVNDDADGGQMHDVHLIGNRSYGKRDSRAFSVLGCIDCFMQDNFAASFHASDLDSRGLPWPTKDRMGNAYHGLECYLMIKREGGDFAQRCIKNIIVKNFVGRGTQSDTADNGAIEISNSGNQAPFQGTLTLSGTGPIGAQITAVSSDALFDVDRPGDVGLELRELAPGQGRAVIIGVADTSNLTATVTVPFSGTSLADENWCVGRDIMENISIEADITGAKFAGVMVRKSSTTGTLRRITVKGLFSECVKPITLQGGRDITIDAETVLSSGNTLVQITNDVLGEVNLKMATREHRTTTADLLTMGSSSGVFQAVVNIDWTVLGQAGKIDRAFEGLASVTAANIGRFKVLGDVPDPSTDTPQGPFAALSFGGNQVAGASPFLLPVSRANVALTLSNAAAGAGRTLTAAQPLFDHKYLGRDIRGINGMAGIGTITSIASPTSATIDISTAFGGTSLPVGNWCSPMTDPNDELLVGRTVLVYSGQVTDIAIGPHPDAAVTGDLATLYRSTGRKSGYFVLKPGEALRITHTAAPSFRVWPNRI